MMASGTTDQSVMHNLLTLLNKADRGWMFARACKSDNVNSAEQVISPHNCKSSLNASSGKEVSFKSLFIRSMPPSLEYDRSRKEKLTLNKGRHARERQG